MSGPCMCGDPWCGRCGNPPSACPLCGKLRPESCEECWNEETEGACAGGCDCDCSCDEADVKAWQDREAEAWEAEQKLYEELKG